MAAAIPPKDKPAAKPPFRRREFARIPRPQPHGSPRLAVFISGGGRSLINLQDAIELGDLSASIALVVASRDCPGVAKAKARGLHVTIEPGRIPTSRVDELLREHRIDWVVLAGYLHLLAIPERFRGRAVNIHPALLPDFGGPGMYGHHVHQAVIDAGHAVTGCTVHMCDDIYDHGAVVLQLTCPVLPEDTADTLAARVFMQECKAYPIALQGLIAGSLKPGSARSSHTKA